MTDTTVVLIGMGLLLAFALAGPLDFESEIGSNELYCEMTALYETSNGQHGWPSYKEGVQCP